METNNLRIIARREGSPLLIDTPEEYRAALSFLANFLTDPEKGLDEEIASAFVALEALEPEMRVQVNGLFRDCTGENCFPLFIPLPENAAYGFFVFQADATPFVPLPVEKWNHIIEPLQKNVPQTPEEERGRLSTVAARFEAEVAPKDLPGTFGNLYAYFFPKGQQGCVDKARTEMQVVSALEAMGLLRFHHLDADHPLLGNLFVHVAVRLVENATQQIYVLDTWNSQKDPEVGSESWWRERNAYLFERPRL